MQLSASRQQQFMLAIFAGTSGRLSCSAQLLREFSGGGAPVASERVALSHPSCWRAVIC